MRYNTDITVCVDSLKSALNIASNNPTQFTLNVTVIASTLRPSPHSIESKKDSY